MRLRSFFVAMVLTAMTSFSMAQQSVTTIFGADNSFAGNTFDVSSATGATITGFDINLAADPAIAQTIAVYYKLGTAVGSENTAGAWTLLGTDNNVLSNGLDVPTPVSVPSLDLAAGQVYGFYVDLVSYNTLGSNSTFVSSDSGDRGGSIIAYTNGGPTDYTDGNVTITTNTGQASPAFSGSFFPREWNGTVHYSIASVPTLGEFGMAAMILLMVGAGVYFMKRRA